jgi:hypothetical protein
LQEGNARKFSIEKVQAARFEMCNQKSGKLKNSLRCLSLGGAALQRCDNWHIFNAGFSR